MKTETPPKNAPAEKKAGRADGPHRSHAINTIALELNAAGEIRSYDEGAWATVFAIHNLFRGKDHPSTPVPIQVRFGGNTAVYAITAIKKGTHFTVSGSLDYNQSEDGKEWYQISADQLRVHSLKDKAPAASAA
jgi:hypothetical protein